jgi:hypothetical protein
MRACIYPKSALQSARHHRRGDNRYCYRDSAVYSAARKQLQVQASTTATTATLQVFVTSTDTLIGTLRKNRTRGKVLLADQSGERHRQEQRRREREQGRDRPVAPSCPAGNNGANKERSLPLRYICVVHQCAALAASVGILGINLRLVPRGADAVNAVAPITSIRSRGRGRNLRFWVAR